MVRIVGQPVGTRPFRSVVDFTESHVEEGNGQRFSLASYLRQQTGKVIDMSVRLGSQPSLWLPPRLLALPVSPEVTEQRRGHLL